VITSVFHWLSSIINICNKELGTPFDRCKKVFEGAVADCRAKLGPFFENVCNITYIVNTLCYVMKPLDFMCILVSYIGDTVIGAVRNSTHSVTNLLHLLETRDVMGKPDPPRGCFEQQRILYRV